MSADDPVTVLSEDDCWGSLSSVWSGWLVTVTRAGGPKSSRSTSPPEAGQTPLQPWPATLEPHYVRVIAMQITERRFKFGPQPSAPVPIYERG